QKVLTTILQPLLRRHFSQFVSAGDLVFDVGANVGNLTEAFIDLGSSVVAVDPHPYCVDLLDRRFAENDHVTVIPCALSDQTGALPFYPSLDNHATSTLSRRWKDESRYAGSRSWAAPRQVSVTTLDHLIAQHGRPQFCKIDVEGHELHVLKGLSSPIPFLSFEVTGEFLDEADQCAQHLETLGPVRFAYSPFLAYWPMSTWVDRARLLRQLQSYPPDLIFGDVYARFN
ncbi:MAG: FkbM family methyltransferase, partial [Candidatus Promineifilaceae bacterium]|nr:FkbM family methyltransferase [Candidatus Promineifilaceae bacterium]